MFITARQFNQNPENWVSNLRRLVARDVQPGGSFLKNPEPLYKHESPGGYVYPARWFLENFQKPENHRYNREYEFSLTLYVMQLSICIKGIGFQLS